MHLWEGVRLAMAQIRTEKLKSFFSLLGVIIGVMFLIVVVSVVEGMDRYIREDFGSFVFGINTVTVSRTPQVSFSSPDPEERRARARRPRLTYDDWDALRERMRTPAVIAVESRVNANLAADNGRTAENAWLTGASAEIFQVRDWEVANGRPFSLQEEREGVPVLVLGASVAETLFPDVDPVGHRVRVRGYPYRVIGVLEAQGSLFGISLDNIVVAPARSAVQRISNPRGVVDMIIIRTPSPELVPAARVEAEGIMRTLHRLRPGEPNDFEVETADESLGFWNRISRMLFLALPGLVAISLVVGGIVIMNIMLVSVMERTREIGVRKALGARRRDILTQVLIEGATLSGFGALLGVAVGIGLTALVRAASPLPAAVDPKWIAVGLALGVVVGVASGVYPASRASRLDPVDALRYE